MRRMGSVDAAFLYGETPAWHMHVSAVLIADPTTAPGGFSVEELKRRIGHRLHLAPQFRWRLVEVPFGLGRPGWVEDPDFDIDQHVRRIGLPAPGGPEQLGNLIGDLVSLKLDRRKPLWEFWVIEGLEGGRIAVLAKVHHSIIDGVSGSELAAVLFDLEPDPPSDGDPPPRVFEEVPNPFDLLLRGVAETLLTPWRVARLAEQSLRQGLKFLGFQRQSYAPVAPFQAPRTSFNTELTPHRRFAYATVPLDEVRRIKKVFDVKVNDVVLALCSGALRRYLVKNDELPDQPLIAQIPVSMRAEDDRTEVGTKVGAMFASLATDVADPVLRLLSIHESTKNAKEMQRTLAAEKIMGITEAAPPALISLAARMYTAAHLDRRTPPIMNLIISNVPGPPFPLYVAGAEIESLYPMGPLLYGTGVNVTVFSYRDRVDFGFMVCREAVPQPWILAEGIEETFLELRAAADAVSR
ncbi:WS/DGAT/MGAT family O-acyltransferase [Rhabdothermincola sediminis]|uniref:WS/DGAT/MGAT family O-acyltransferase n=1 Tax=Rhabdothermincola sediminis TaxID=2751370 RepID=UPI001AA08228|nr:wax ester/triacylglycerol synthase family O-acyltransferase [Rhabdothermincola sediminis]